MHSISKYGFCLLLSFAFFTSNGFGSSSAFGQSGAPKPSIKLGTPRPSFRPTFNFGSGSVGNYFYPQTVGSSWKMKIVQKYLGANNKIIAADSMISEERVVDNATKTFEGLPTLTCQALSWRPQDPGKIDTEVVAYYVDDSIIMAIFNNSVSNNQNRVLLVSPLKVGGKWLEKTEDSARTTIASMDEHVDVPFGKYTNALATVTKLGKIEMWKYFVPTVGIVKTSMHMPGRRPDETITVTSELIELNVGVALAPEELSAQPDKLGGAPAH